MIQYEQTAGSKHKHMHMQKSRHFDRVASLKPVDLEKRMALSEEEEETYRPRAISVENEKSKEDEKAWRLVEEAKSSIASKCLTMSKAEKKLLFDFFEESSEEYIENAEEERQLSKVAEEWISGESQQTNLGWEMCVREMDKCWRWTNISDEERKQLGMELEFEVLTSLVNELVLELTS